MADCPCGITLPPGDRNILNFGLNNDFIRNPNAAAVSATRNLLGGNRSKLNGIIDTFSNPSLTGFSTFLPALQRVQNKMNSTQALVDAFDAESKRLSDPRNLAAAISSLNLFANMSCALGIEGVDVTGGLNVVNHNGKFAIESSLNVQVDMDRILNKIQESQAYQDLKSGLTDLGGEVDIATLQSEVTTGLSNIDNALGAANNAINSVMAAADAIQSEAAAFIEKFTNINFFSNLISNDECNKLNSTVKGNLVSPEFLNVVKTNAVSPVGGGTSTR